MRACAYCRCPCSNKGYSSCYWSLLLQLGNTGRRLSPAHYHCHFSRSDVRRLVLGPWVSSGFPRHTFTTLSPIVCHGAIMPDDRPPLSLDAHGQCLKFCNSRRFSLTTRHDALLLYKWLQSLHCWSCCRARHAVDAIGYHIRFQQQHCILHWMVALFRDSARRCLSTYIHCVLCILLGCYD